MTCRTSGDGMCGWRVNWLDAEGFQHALRCVDERSARRTAEVVCQRPSCFHITVVSPNNERMDVSELKLISTRKREVALA